MDFAPAYLIQRFFYRLGDFFHHWYIDGSRVIGSRFIGTLEAVDRAFALRVTVRHFFEPLYRDYSPVGRVLGVLFRTFRILLGAILYAAIGGFFLLTYLVWIVIPAGLIAYAAYSLTRHGF